MLHQTIPADKIRLRCDGDDRSAHISQFTGDELVARSDALIRGKAKDHAIHFGEGLAHHVVEALAEQGPGPVISGGVDEDDLRVLLVDDAANVVARCFRSTRGDRDLLADQGVRQG